MPGHLHDMLAALPGLGYIAAFVLVLFGIFWWKKSSFTRNTAKFRRTMKLGPQLCSICSAKQNELLHLRNQVKTNKEFRQLSNQFKVRPFSFEISSFPFPFSPSSVFFDPFYSLLFFFWFWFLFLTSFSVAFHVNHHFRITFKK